MTTATNGQGAGLDGAALLLQDQGQGGRVERLASGALSLLTGAPAVGPELLFWPVVGCWP